MRKFLIKKVAIFLTEQCDKKCTYCDIPKVQDPKPPNKQLLEKFVSISSKLIRNRVAGYIVHLKKMKDREENSTQLVS